MLAALGTPFQSAHRAAGETVQEISRLGTLTPTTVLGVGHTARIDAPYPCAEVSTLREHIETAKMSRVEPYAYLEATLVTIAHCHPASKLDQRLPWAFNSASR